jgi:hypothetical protein
MPDERPAYRVDIPLLIEHEIGLDPAQLSEHRLLQIKGVRGLQLCESLFWVVRQLALVPEHSGHIYSPTSLNEALANIGEIGQALAASTSEHVERLEHLVDRAREGKPKRKR